MNLNQFAIRGFVTVDASGAQVPACAMFLYKGYQISFSTIGLDKGACQTHVCIFTGKDFQNVYKDGFDTVQNAIYYIDTTS